MISSPIVSADELLRALDRVRIVDCRSGPSAREAYLAAHLRGAVHADLERDLSTGGARPERGGRHPLPSVEAFAATLGRLGIDPSTSVVLYDDKGGANAAARAWWMLRAVGHERVAVLDGGLAAAERAGIPLEAGDVGVEERPPYPVERWQRPTADIEEVARRAHDAEWALVDVRAPERYRGDVEPLDPVAGHIPGARNVPLTESLDVDGRFRSPAELRAHFAERLGERSMERVIVSCGSGVTACHTLLALERAGLFGASLYVGSWSEWCRSGREGASGEEPG